MSDFGVIVVCCKKDYLYARGCCASVRHYMPDVPIALVVDGNFSVRDLINSYGVKVIRKKDVEDSFLRENSFGFGYSSMLSWWCSPWERFLKLDADTIVFGDVSARFPYREFDVLTDDYGYEMDDDALRKSFFDPNTVSAAFPELRWKEERSSLFNCGVYFGRRGTFDIEEYKRVFEVGLSDPKIFPLNVQGVFNVMVMRGVQEGEVRKGKQMIQQKIGQKSPSCYTYEFDVTAPGKSDSVDPCIIHYCGRKPAVSSLYPEMRGMTHFRRSFWKNKTNIFGELMVKGEDFGRLVEVFKKRVKSQFM